MRKFFGILLVAVLTLFAPLASARDSQGSTTSEAVNSYADRSNSTGRPRVGLALGGGGSRGAAHVGVLKVLLEEKIPIDVIAGTSIGSVVGGFYASGMSIDDLSEIFTKKTFTKQFAPMPLLRLVTEPAELSLRLFGYKPYDGLYHGWKFKKYANKMANNRKIEELKIPYAAVVTDVVTGKSCRLTKGDLGEAMTASTAVPGLRKPVQIGERLFCDGGVINNVPVNHAKEMGADFVIAIDIDEQLKERPLKDFKGLGSMARQALKIQLATFDESRLKEADFCIRPDTTGINLVSFKKADGSHGIEEGIKAAREAMPELKKKLAAIGILTESNGSEM